MGLKVLVSMSGGVDSSVAAWLLKREGFDCTGITMKLYNESTCCSIDDVRDARSVAAKLDMSFYVFNFTEQFKNEVIERFAASYQSGQTPNPCIYCNRYIKFNELLLRAENLDYDYIATGHYARLKYEEGRYLLYKGTDSSKDQSYVLYCLTQAQLARTLFPLGELDKRQVREYAAQLALINAGKPDSQDICFVVDGNYSKFIEIYTGTKSEKGDITDIHGQVIGKHMGIIHYTIGQRRGLNIAHETPLYVKTIDTVNNVLVVAEEQELYSKVVVIKDINLIAFDKIETPIKVSVKLRYKHSEEKAWARQEDDNIILEFDNPQRAVARGQAAVLYDGDLVIGGGTIC